MKRPVMILFPLLLGMSGLAPSTFAQTNNNPVSSALRDFLPGREKNTVAAVEAMPADKFNFRPTPDQMTFGHLVAHMIESNYLFCSKAAGTVAPKTDGVTDSDPKEKLVAALQGSFAFCSESLGKLEDAKLGESTEGFGGKTVTRGWFGLVLASSWADHYAEAAMYLRLNGVAPPTAKH
ncbi:MAG TPA: DinB family protein [Verrucomicrobiae bacterium]|nr:DinB family protein [Verrucomicrobiae bacterium]